MKRFKIGQTVTATQTDDHEEFIGKVKGYHERYITVEDQDGDCWDCNPQELSVGA